MAAVSVVQESAQESPQASAQESVREPVQEFIAVRTPEEIDRAAIAAALCGGPGARGAAAAYRWVLTPGTPSPVTGTVCVCRYDADLAAEERAALLTARDTTRPAAERRHARGVADALGWVLGFAPLND
ncbi:hypothetical protein [Kitasatospora sp. DSM 101779]|uniref:hypothetical protein n=1 Tax=Kitasatospora sp. DSM 101779 TaxID=2853165 RepID=UPI0021DAF474|nr:hypothetical protein [Kitasatospora sp. DSM 101779]MCU7826832.1 hypothetical protein [Kitasatospora sp. DSM 101779]